MKRKLISSSLLLISLVTSLAADLDPTLLGSWPGFERLSYAAGVAATGNHAYVVDLGRLWVIDLSDPTTPETIGSCNYDQGYCDWGYCTRRPGR